MSNEKIESLREDNNTMFQKYISLTTLNTLTDELWPTDYSRDKISDIVKTFLDKSNYSESMKRKLKSQLVTTFKSFHVKHAELKHDLHNRIFRIWNTGGDWESQLPIYYLLLMLLSHKNFPPLFATLAHFKRKDALFTTKIFLSALPEEAKDKAPSTVYEIVNQFLMQLSNFECLTKVASIIYKVPKYKTDWELREYIRRVIAALPDQYRDDLYEVFNIAKKEPSFDTDILGWLRQRADDRA